MESAGSCTVRTCTRSWTYFPVCSALSDPKETAFEREKLKVASKYNRVALSVADGMTYLWAIRKKVMDGWVTEGMDNTGSKPIANQQSIHEFVDASGTTARSKLQTHRFAPVGAKPMPVHTVPLLQDIWGKLQSDVKSLQWDWASSLVKGVVKIAKAADIKEPLCCGNQHPSHPKLPFDCGNAGSPCFSSKGLFKTRGFAGFSNSDITNLQKLAQHEMNKAETSTPKPKSTPPPPIGTSSKESNIPRELQCSTAGALRLVPVHKIDQERFQPTDLPVRKYKATVEYTAAPWDSQWAFQTKLVEQDRTLPSTFDWTKNGSTPFGRLEMCVDRIKHPQASMQGSYPAAKLGKLSGLRWMPFLATIFDHGLHGNIFGMSDSNYNSIDTKYANLGPQMRSEVAWDRPPGRPHNRPPGIRSTFLNPLATYATDGEALLAESPMSLGHRRRAGFNRRRNGVDDLPDRPVR